MNTPDVLMVALFVHALCLELGYDQGERLARELEHWPVFYRPRARA